MGASLLSRVERRRPPAPLRDFGDSVLLPGLVDSHVHINEPGRTEWEGFQTATQAAAAGGVTTLVDMPLNCIPETIELQALEAKRAAANGKAWVDWAAWGGVVRGNCRCAAATRARGVPGFKCFLIHSGIDGFAWVDEADLRARPRQTARHRPAPAGPCRTGRPRRRRYAKLNAARRGLAQILNLSGLPPRCRGGRSHRPAHPPRRRIRDADPYRPSGQRPGFAPARRCAQARPAHHRRNLRSIFMVRR